MFACGRKHFTPESTSPPPPQGWYIVTYALGIYHLNLLLAFLTPKIDPALAELEAEEADDGMELPTRQTDEFRPFIR